MNMKQVFEANTKLRRVICAVLVAIMVIGMIPLSAPKAAALSKGAKIYLQPNDNWKQASARFAAYFFNDNKNRQEWAAVIKLNQQVSYVRDGITKNYELGDRSSDNTMGC